MPDERDQPVLFTARQADRISAAVRLVEGDAASLGGEAAPRGIGAGNAVVLAKLGGQGTGDYAGLFGWQMVDSQGATLDYGGSVAVSPVADPLGLGVGPGSLVAMARAIVTVGREARGGFAAIGAGGVLVPVLLARTGGGAGGGTNAATCSFTYAAYSVMDKDLTTPIATTVSPTGGGTRIPGLEHTAATTGIGYWDPTGTATPRGTFVLQFCNERPVMPGAC